MSHECHQLVYWILRGRFCQSGWNTQFGFYVYGCVKVGDSYYLQLCLAPNQTTANVDNGSELVAMYAALPAEGATYPTSGARMTLKKVTDEALLEELLKSAPQGFTPMYYEIVAVRSLG